MANHENLLEGDFIKIFKPLHITQTVLGCMGVSIKHKFVRKLPLYRKVYSPLLILLVGYCVHKTLEMQNTIRHYKQSVHNVNKPYSFSQYWNTYCMFAVILVKRTYCHNEKNVLIYVLMQKVDRVLQMNARDRLYKKFFLVNLSITSTILIIHTIYFCLRVKFELSFLFVTSIPCFCCFTITFVEMSDYFSIVYFIGSRLTYVNDLMINMNKLNWNCVVRNSEAKTSDDSVLRKISNAYKLISEVNDLSQDVFSYFFFMVTVHTLMNILISVERIIILGKDIHMVFLLIMLGIDLQMSSSLLIAVTANKWISDKVTNTRKICLALYEKHPNEHVKKISKNLRRLLDAHMQPFSVYGMYTLDAELPLLLLDFTTTYTLVLLQFAFL